MSASAAPAGRSGASFASLPDSALVTIFSKCTMSERLQRLSLVCKQWRNLCATPSLVSKVAVKGTGDDALQRMRSLQLWLAQRTTHVRELSLTIGNIRAGAIEVMQLVAAAAACCGAQLRRLEIRLTAQQQPRLVASSWLCGLTGLTHLHLRAMYLHVTVSLTGLTALDRLTFGAVAMEHPATPWLPPNLTALACFGARLPEQATSLQRLQYVELRAQAAATLAGSLGVVTRLAPSFDDLFIEGGLAAVPPELAALSGQLQALELHSSLPGVVVDTGSVSALTGLTALYLRAPYALSPAAGLQQLSRLQRLMVSKGASRDMGPAQAPAPVPPGQLVLRSLPPGAWLGGLTDLWIDYDVLFGSLDVLPAASNLQQLNILRLQCMLADPPPGEPQPDWAALRSWLCSHPPMRRLFLEHCTTVCGEVLDLVLHLAQRRPGLAVRRRKMSKAL